MFLTSIIRLALSQHEMLVLETCKHYADKKHYLSRIFETNDTLKRSINVICEGVKYLATMPVGMVHLPIGM